MKVKNYFRYADDIVVFASNKEYLHQLLSDIGLYMQTELKLEVKKNYQVFPVASKHVKGRGVDFLGYVFYHDHIRLRKLIKQKYFRMLASNPNWQSIASYHGWMIHANCKNLLNPKQNDTNKKIHRLRDRNKIDRICRQEKRNRRHFRSANKRAQIQNSAFKVSQRPGTQQMLAFADIN